MVGEGWTGSGSGWGGGGGDRGATAGSGYHTGHTLAIVHIQYRCLVYLMSDTTAAC